MGIVAGVDLRVLRYFVAVAEERHVRRAAERLHMSQPPLSRALRALEAELGAVLLNRTPQGVTLTAAGEALHTEAKALLEQAERLRVRVAAAAGTTTLTVGTLADAVEFVGGRLVGAFRERYPHVQVTVVEADLGDPTAGLRAGLVDVALTRTPFDDTGIAMAVVSTDAVGVVMRTDDPLAGRASVAVGELADRRWVRLPADTDPAWAAYWTGPPSDEGAPVRRTIQECLQAVLWNGMSALAPVGQAVPDGLVVVPATDRPPSSLVVAWPRAGAHPLARAFAVIAAG